MPLSEAAAEPSEMTLRGEGSNSILAKGRASLSDVQHAVDEALVRLPG